MPLFPDDMPFEKYHIS